MDFPTYLGRVKVLVNIVTPQLERIARDKGMVKDPAIGPYMQDSVVTVKW